MATKPPNDAVIPPNTINKNNTSFEYSMNIEHRIIKNTPAVT